MFGAVIAGAGSNPGSNLHREVVPAKLHDILEANHQIADNVDIYGEYALELPKGVVKKIIEKNTHNIAKQAVEMTSAWKERRKTDQPKTYAALCGCIGRIVQFRNLAETIERNALEELM